MIKKINLWAKLNTTDQYIPYHFPKTYYLLTVIELLIKREDRCRNFMIKRIISTHI